MTDERMRRRAVERVRVGAVLLGLGALLVWPNCVLDALDTLGYYWAHDVTVIGYGTSALIEIGVIGGLLLLALPAYLFLLPGRWVARVNHVASVRWASVLYACSLGLFCATMLLAIGWGQQIPALKLVMAAGLIGALGVGMAGWGLAHLRQRTRRTGMLVVAACCGLLALDLGVSFGCESAHLVCAGYGWQAPVWIDTAFRWAVIGMGVSPLVLLIGSVVAAISAHKLVVRIIKEGECPSCGYDLGGQKAQGCPECGWGRGEVSVDAG